MNQMSRQYFQNKNLTCREYGQPFTFAAAIASYRESKLFSDPKNKPCGDLLRLAIISDAAKAASFDDLRYC